MDVVPELFGVGIIAIVLLISVWGVLCYHPNMFVTTIPTLAYESISYL